MCLKGARACPPEDVGGIHGFADVAAWLRAGAPRMPCPPFEDAEHALGWLHDAYDPTRSTPGRRRMPCLGLGLPVSTCPGTLPEPLADLVKALRSEGWVQATEWLASLSAHGRRARRGRRGPRVASVAGGVGCRRVGCEAHGRRVPAPGARGADRDRVRHPSVVDRHGEPGGSHLPGRHPARERAGERSACCARSRERWSRPPAPARSPVALELVGAVLGRMPLGRGFDAEAGWFALLGLPATRVWALPSTPESPG